MNSLPLRLWLAGGLFMLTALGLVRPAVAQKAATQPAATQPQVAQPQGTEKDRYWTTNWSFQNVDIQTLFGRLRSIGVDIPIRGQGAVSTDFKVGVPWTSLRSGKAYRFEGKIHSKRLRLEKLLLENFAADVTYSEGRLRLENVRGRWSDLNATSRQSDRDPSSQGAFTGSASLQLLPRGDLQADLKAQSLPLRPLHDLVLSASRRTKSKRASGRIGGDIHVRVPLSRLGDLSRWTSDANLQIENLRVGNSLPLSVVTGPIQIRDGVIIAETLDLSSPVSDAMRAQLGLQLELIGRRRFAFRARANDLPTESIAAFFSPNRSVARGRVDLDASGRGELATSSWEVSGRIASPMLKVWDQEIGRLEHQFEIDAKHLKLSAIDPEAAANHSLVRLQSVSMEYEFHPDHFDVTHLQARLLNGTFSGTAQLARNDLRQHHFQLEWTDLSPTIATSGLLPTRQTITASSSGTVDWSVPFGSLNQPAAHRGTASMQLDRVGVGNVGAGQFQLRLRCEEEGIQITGDGTLLGGPCNVRAAYDVLPTDSWNSLLDGSHRGRIEARSMRLDSIVRVLGSTNIRRWGGDVSAALQWDSNATEPEKSRPRLDLSMIGIRVGAHAIARDASVTCRLVGERIKIERGQASLAGGHLSASGNWSSRGNGGRVQVRLTSVDACDTLRLFSEAASDAADGKVSGSLTVTNGDRIRVQGLLTARDSEFFTIPTGRLTTELVATLTRDLKRWKVGLSSIRGSLGKGRLAGEALLSSSSIRSHAYDLTSRWDANHVDFGQLQSDLNWSSSFAHGRVTGNLTLGGRGIRGVDDLSGRFTGKLGATQAGAIPGLLKTEQYLGLITLGGVQFEEGYVRGLIGHGAATIDEFWLRSDQVRVFADGFVRLDSTRADFDVVVSTGNFAFGDAKLLAFASQLAIQSVAPATALVEVNRLLSQRTIHLDFLGRLSDPRVRIKPVETIQAEAARFLLREALIAASVLGNQ